MSSSSNYLYSFVNQGLLSSYGISSSAYEKYLDNIKAANNELVESVTASLVASRSNFAKVKTFNTTANVERITEKPTAEIFDSKPDIIESALKLIREEVSELEEAVKAKDLTETRDALADILYVVYGMAFRLGINADKDFDLVHKSNMTKFCTNENDAVLTVKKYEEKYAAGESPYPSPAYRLDESTGLWVIYEKTTGKILKSHLYTPVKLD